MATHATALSQWLPGLDPDTAEFPDLFADQNIPASCPSSPPPAEFPSTLATVEFEEEVLRSCSGVSWRKSATASEAVPRVLWPTLKGDDLGNFGGPAAKFEANLAAIDLLRRIEAANRTPVLEERVVLQRFTGW